MSTVLLLVDVQDSFFRPVSGPPVHDSAVVLTRITELLARARAAGTPVVFLRHGEAGDPQFDPGSPGWMLSLAARPAEPVIDKTTPDGFAGTLLAETLAGMGADRLVIAGCQSEFCIATTAAAAYRRGFAVTLVRDAHSTWDDWQGRDTAPGIIAAQNEGLAAVASLKQADELAF